MTLTDPHGRKWFKLVGDVYNFQLITYSLQIIWSPWLNCTITFGVSDKSFFMLISLQGYCFKINDSLVCPEKWKKLDCETQMFCHPCVFRQLNPLSSLLLPTSPPSTNSNSTLPISTIVSGLFWWLANVAIMMLGNTSRWRNWMSCQNIVNPKRYITCHCALVGSE